MHVGYCLALFFNILPYTEASITKKEIHEYNELGGFQHGVLLSCVEFVVLNKYLPCD